MSKPLDWPDILIHVGITVLATVLFVFFPRTMFVIAVWAFWFMREGYQEAEDGTFSWNLREWSRQKHMEWALNPVIAAIVLILTARILG